MSDFIKLCLVSSSLALAAVSGCAAEPDAPASPGDETVFESPDELDLRRTPNPHLAFGIGPHFCLGANLARMEITTVFQELLTRLPDITVPTDVLPSRGDSTLVLALNHLPASFTPGSGCPVQH